VIIFLTPKIKKNIGKQGFYNLEADSFVALRVLLFCLSQLSSIRVNV